MCQRINYGAVCECEDNVAKDLFVVELMRSDAEDDDDTITEIFDGTSKLLLFLVENFRAIREIGHAKVKNFFYEDGSLNYEDFSDTFSGLVSKNVKGKSIFHMGDVVGKIERDVGITKIETK